MHTQALILFIFLLLTPLQASADSSLQSDCAHTNDSFQCVQYLRNYDADTITVNVPGLHPLLGKKISIRVSGIDTPEIRTKNKCEKEKAKIAKKWVQHVLAQAKRIDLRHIKRGKYFRIVADVYVDGVNLTDILLNKGMGYPYQGGTKRKINWCLGLEELAAQFRKESSADHTRGTASK